MGLKCIFCNEPTSIGHDGLTHYGVSCVIVGTKAICTNCLAQLKKYLEFE